MNASTERRVRALEAVIAPPSLPDRIPCDVDDPRTGYRRDIWNSGAPDDQAERIVLRIVCAPVYAPNPQPAPMRSDGLQGADVELMAAQVRAEREAASQATPARPKPVAKLFGRMIYDDITPPIGGRRQ